MNLRDETKPTPAPNEVLIRVAYAGICGSELSGYLGHNALRVPPLVMGHEFCGEVIAFGSEANARNPKLSLGTRVTVNPFVTCGACEYCRRGLNQLCTTRQLIGAHRSGAFAELVTAPAELALPLPEDMSFQVGAITEPAAVGVRIGELAGDLTNQIAFVVGAGPIGLLAMQALFARGAQRVFITDLDPTRRKMADELGGESLDPRAADVTKTIRDATEGLGAMGSVDAVGTGATRAQCIAATRSGGTVILTGLHEEASAMPVSDVIRREIVLHGSFAYTPANYADALARLARGEMRLSPWVVESPLGEGGPWFERLVAGEGNVAKVLLKP